MSAPTPTTEPARIVAGDTAIWLKTLPDYPAGDGWVLTYTLVNSDQRQTIVCSASGDQHLAQVAAATTAAWAPGDCALRGQVALSGDVRTVVEQRVTIAPAYGAAADSRSPARRQLEAVEAVIESRASSAVLSYSIGGRQLQNIPITDLLILRDRLRVDVWREDAAARSAAGLAPRGRIAVRFGP